MTITIKTKHYIDSKKNIEFSYPADWVISDNITLPENTTQILFPKPQQGWRPMVELTVLDNAANGLNTSLLDKITNEIQKNSKNFVLHDKKIKSGGDGRGGLLYQYEEDSLTLLGQKILIPLANNRILSLTGVTEKSVWSQFAPLIMLIVNSAKVPLKEEPLSELEIVYENKPSHNSSAISAEHKTQSLNIEKSKTTPVVKNKDFAQFSSKFLKQWKTCTNKQELISVLKDEQIAIVLWAALGSYIKNWIYEPVTALSGRSPIDCLKTPLGIKQLKDLLLLLNDEASNLREISASNHNPSTCGLSDTDILSEIDNLLQVDNARRDSDWLIEIDQLICTASFYAPDRPFAKTDAGFMFYWLYTQAPRDSKQGRRVRISEISTEVAQQQGGIMIVGQNDATRPLSFGEICFLNSYKKLFIVGNEPSAPPSLKRDKKTGFYYGPPSDSFFPPIAREFVKKLMNEHYGVRKPAVLLAYKKDYSPPFCLSFNLEEGKLKTDEEFNIALASIAWAVPPCSFILATHTAKMESQPLFL
jgi:hypothetical protein